MDLREFLSLARAFSNLGWSVQAQFEAVVEDGEEVQDQNPSAMRAVLKVLRQLQSHDVDGARELADAIARLLKD